MVSSAFILLQDDRVMREGLELVSEAVRLDTAGDHKGALDKYYLGCERLMHAYRCESLPGVPLARTSPVYGHIVE